MATYAIGAVPAGSEVDPCCCEPTPCCMYPSAEVDIGFPSTDLPATLTSGVDVLTLSGTTYTGGTKTIVLDSGQWRFEDSSNSDVAISNCLIGIYTGVSGPDQPIADQFPSGLSVDIPSLSITGMAIERLDIDTNPCNWYGCQFYEQVDGVDHFLVVQVNYNSATYKFELIVEIWSGSDCGTLFEVLSTTTTEKDGTMETPVGTYGANTVS